jgi:hypothetical protein
MCPFVLTDMKLHAIQSQFFPTVQLYSAFKLNLILQTHFRHSTFIPAKAFHWILLKKPPVLEQIQRGVKYMADVGQKSKKMLDENVFFD